MGLRETRAVGTALLLVAALALLTLQARRLRHEALWEMEYRQWVDGQDYSTASWRYWEDMKFAIGRYLDATHASQRGRRAQQEQERLQRALTSQTELTEAYRTALEQETARQRIQPHQFWRTIPDEPLLRRRRPYQLPPFEDHGRAMLGAAAFRLLGGVSPYLLVWSALLLALLQILWFFLELARGGHAIAGACLVLLLSAWPYFVETLTLPHSAVGFYMVAALLGATLAVYGTLGRGRSWAMLWVRVAAAGAVFAVCTVCRSGCIVMLPAIALSLWAAVGRIQGPGATSRDSRARLLVTVAACAAFLLPYLAIRPSERHALWIGLWEGLGDYGQAHGYSWHDRDAKRFMEEHGLEPFQHPNEVQPAHEAFFRRAFLDGIRREPLWYAGVLARRAVATLTQSKLWPHRRWQGRSVSDPIFHYKYVVPADWFGLGRPAVEVPLPILWAPVVYLAVRAARASRGAPARRRLSAVGLCGLCALPLPIIVSTASGIETQVLALAYLLAGAFVMQDLAELSGRALRPLARARDTRANVA